MSGGLSVCFLFFTHGGDCLCCHCWFDGSPLCAHFIFCFNNTQDNTHMCKQQHVLISQPLVGVMICGHVHGSEHGSGQGACLMLVAGTLQAVCSARPRTHVVAHHRPQCSQAQSNTTVCLSTVSGSRVPPMGGSGDNGPAHRACCRPFQDMSGY